MISSISIALSNVLQEVIVNTDSIVIKYFFISLLYHKTGGMGIRFHACRVSICGLGDVRFPVPTPSECN